MVAYAIGQTVTGKLMDAIGTRLGMTVSIIELEYFHCSACAGQKYFIVQCVPLFLGISEAGNWPGATKADAEWFPAKERAIAQGIFGARRFIGQRGSSTGDRFLISGFWLEGNLCRHCRVGHIYGQFPGCLLSRQTPDKHPWITKEEQDHIRCATFDLSDESNSGTPQQSVYSWKQLLQFKNTWGIISSRFFIDPVWWLFVTWLPTFLKEQYHFDMKQIGAFAWVPYLFAAIGGLAGGFFFFPLYKAGNACSESKKAGYGNWFCINAAITHWHCCLPGTFKR